MTQATPSQNGAGPAWAECLSDDDWQFLKRFLLASGSLKDLATQYAVSYPTVRARLDRLMAKVQAADDPKLTDPFERRIRSLVADGELAPATARQLLTAHRQSTTPPPRGPDKPVSS